MSMHEYSTIRDIQASPPPPFLYIQPFLPPNQHTPWSKHNLNYCNHVFHHYWIFLNNAIKPTPTWKQDKKQEQETFLQVLSLWHQIWKLFQYGGLSKRTSHCKEGEGGNRTWWQFSSILVIWVEFYSWLCK